MEAQRHNCLLAKWLIRSYWELVFKARESTVSTSANSGEATIAHGYHSITMVPFWRSTMEPVYTLGQRRGPHKGGVDREVNLTSPLYFDINPGST